MPLEERSSKYLRSIEKTLLNNHCHKIKRDAVLTVNPDQGSENEGHPKFYKCIKESDRVIGECFDDWARPRIDINLLSLRKQLLIKSVRIEHLSC